MPGNLFSRLMDNFPASPDAVFIETSQGEVIRYATMLDQSARVAGLLEAIGVRPGDRVAVQVEKSVHNVMLYLGCVRAGAVYLPLNTAYTAAELGYFLGDAEPVLVICGPEDRAVLEKAGGSAGVRIMTLGADGEGDFWEAAMAARAPGHDAERDDDDLCAILYTSGTTGRSKGAMLTHANLASNAQVLRDLWRFTQADVLLHALPIYHTHGLFVAINVTLMAGGSMIFLPRFDLDAIFALMPRATCMMGVPTFYTRMLDDARLSRESTRHMRLFISGSAPLLAETHAAFEARTGQRILERYGMTETGMNSSNPYDGERRAGTVGFALPDVSIRVADPETGVPLAPGEIGVLEVKGPNVFKGYWRQPDKTRAEFRDDGFFVTGDLGRIDEDGYIHIVGRAKDLIITGGFNVYPKEIESEIDALPGVVESAVIGVPHKDFGEAVVAVVVARPGADLDDRTIADALKEKLARFKQPKRTIVVDELPRNSMGKVQKAELRNRFHDLFS